MEELEFRFYSKDYGMLRVRKLQGDDTIFPKYISCKTSKGVKQFKRAIKNLMQYTGRKDKNGKKIFRGDVISYYARGNSFDRNSKKCIAIVKFKYSRWYAENIKDEGLRQFNLEDSEHCEVIGNIFENPKLIK